MLLKNSSIDRVRLRPFNSVVLLGNLIFIIQKLGYERYFLAVFIQLKPINIDLDPLLKFRSHLGPSSKLIFEGFNIELSLVDLP